MVQEMVHVFAGNIKTGAVLHKTMVDDELLIEETLDEMLSETGYFDSVWACYDSENSIEDCSEDFARYAHRVFQEREMQ